MRYFVLVCLAVGGLCCASTKTTAPPPEPERCKRTAKMSDVVVEEVVCSQKDADGDGVDDAVDHCPERRETQNNLLDLDGCPDPDRDGDEVEDGLDVCPDEAGPYPEGCPQFDADGDGIPDHLDACVKQPEDIDGDADADGCPDGPSPKTKPSQGVFWKEVKVGCLRSRSRLSRQGGDALGKLEDLLRPYATSVKRVQVKGLAGSQESEGQQLQELAAGRAELVKKGLVSVGIAPHRIHLIAQALPEAQKRRAGYVMVGIWVRSDQAKSLGLSPLEGAQAAKPGGQRPADKAEADAPLVRSPPGQRASDEESDTAKHQVHSDKERDPQGQASPSSAGSAPVHVDGESLDEEWDQEILPDEP